MIDGLARTEGLTDVQEEIIATVREFVDKEILPSAAELEHADVYPQRIVERLKKLGLFGVMIPEEYGGLGESLLTYAHVVEQLARGWMSISGIINTHFIVAWLIARHGTEDQRQRYLGPMAAGEITGAFSMSEPECGSDIAAITTRAVPAADDGGEAGNEGGRGGGRGADTAGTFEITGRKMWITNGASASLVATLVRTGPEGGHRGLSTFLVAKEPGLGQVAPGLTVPSKIPKMGYKGVDTTELIFDSFRIGSGQLLGGETGRGFYQMMDGVEVGRVNVAARGCGVALRALELALDYAQQRHAFGKRIADHQAVLFRLAEMATKVEAAHQMMVMAARRKDAGGRGDLEAGMAKYLASEYCKEVVEDSLRIHGGYGYSSEYEIERLYRDAPMLLIGEGTADIQKMIIGRRLLERSARQADHVRSTRA